MVHSPASEFYVPTFHLVHMTYEDETEFSETSAHKIQKQEFTEKREYNIHNMAKV